MTPYLTTTEAAAVLRMSKRTLESMRVSGNGPPYYQRVQGGRVFYDRQELDAWMAAQKKQSTSQGAA